MSGDIYLNQLKSYANQLSGNDYVLFKSKFVSIVNILKHEMNVAEAVKSGSMAREVSLDNISDMDILYTYRTTNETEAEIKSKAYSILNMRFSNADVVEGSRAVKITFSENRKYDVKYKPYDAYLQERNEIKITKESTNDIKNIIKLIKNWTLSQKKEIESYKVEKVVLYHQIHNRDKSFISILDSSLRFIREDPTVVHNFFKQKMGIL